MLLLVLFLGAMQWRPEQWFGSGHKPTAFLGGQGPVQPSPEVAGMPLASHAAASGPGLNAGLSGAEQSTASPAHVARRAGSDASVKRGGDMGIGKAVTVDTTPLYAHQDQAAPTDPPTDAELPGAPPRPMDDLGNGDILLRRADVELGWAHDPAAAGDLRFHLLDRSGTTISFHGDGASGVRMNGKPVEAATPYPLADGDAVTASGPVGIHIRPAHPTQAAPDGRG